MKQFFKHFGSKARIAAMLPPPTHKIIIEPFAGSAAYSTCHARPDQKVILYDTDERVCVVWDYLIHASENDIRSLPVQHFLNRGDIRDLNLPRPEMLLIQRWLAIAGSHSYKIAPCLLADRGGEAGNTWCEKVRDRIATQVCMIRNWEIHQKSYEEAPDIEAHWHVDSPYQANKHGFAEYKCDPIDFERLGAWCKTRRGDVTVHEQLGAEWLPFKSLRPNHTTNRTVDGTLVTAHEVYWTNDHRGKDGTLSLFGGIR
jgi:hypothetical protein